MRLKAAQDEARQRKREEWWIRNQQEKLRYEAAKRVLSEEEYVVERETWQPELGVDDLTREVLSAIIERIYQGLTLHAACREARTYSGTVMRALARHPDLAVECARARKTYVRAKLDEMYDIAENEPDVQRASLMVNLIKWDASKSFPREYGDSLTLKGDEDNPLTHRVIPAERMRQLTNEELDAALLVAEKLNDGQQDA